MGVPPHLFFMVSALFHYLGPAFAVLLFQHVNVLGVTWLRIASAAVVFALWRRPWRVFRELAPRSRLTLVALGVVLAAMNACFYQAIDRLPLGTVGGIEFLGPVALGAAGVRSHRNLAALGLVIGGVFLLTDIRLASQPLGLLFAFGNCALFVLYVVLGHRIARDGGRSGIDRLGAAMLVALVAISPLAITEAGPAFRDARLLAAGFGVGVCSSVIPYVCDQLAMARLPRFTFALLLALLPATATTVGILVLGQVPTVIEAAGVLLVIAGVATHQQYPQDKVTPEEWRREPGDVSAGPPGIDEVRRVAR
ncbi:MAG: EamA family transporter [Thermoanaerobaculia bacterium]